LDRLKFHQEALGDELTLIQTKTLLQSQMAQEQEFAQAAKQRQHHEEYFKLLQALKTSITHDELSKFERFQVPYKHAATGGDPSGTWLTFK
jgi:hypothetical protein